ncbi:hypothetical protein [Streptomyces sp. NPDC029003]|uniref:hypothetical protein n=1 Tax=Streptomyces sp. NPDC029003 TaxID=3155125 RepID=UPI0033F83593
MQLVIPGETMGNAEHPRRVVRPAPDGPQHTAATTGAATAATGAARARGPLADRLGQRSGELLEAVARLDAGLDPAAGRRLADRIREQYTAEHGGAPVGFLAVCHLGPPYVDHVLDLDGAIVRHHTPGDPPPPPYGAARMLVRHPHYACVEVYSDGLLLPVLTTGAVVRPAPPRPGGAA